MRRAFLPVLLLAAVAAMSLGFTGIAHANSCDTIAVQTPGLTDTQVQHNGDNTAACTSRWYAEVRYEYEYEGSWYTPNGGILDFGTWSDSGYNDDCTTEGPYRLSKYCWGTSDGNGGGYWGSGNEGAFAQYTYIASGGTICGLNWRQAVYLYNWVSGDPLGDSADKIGNTHYSAMNSC